MDRHKMTLRCFALAMAMAGTLSAAPRGADTPAESFSETTTTLLVEVPVEVSSDGTPVRGLTAENFELFDNGRAQQILGVDVIDLREISTQESSNELPVAARRHFLLLFDFTFAQPASLARAQVAAVELIEKDLHPTDLVGLATFSARDGVKFILGFTQDRNQVRAALGQLRASESAVSRIDPLRLSVSRIVDVDQFTRGGGSGGGNARGAANDAGTEILQQILQSEKKRGQQLGRREVKILSDSMINLATTLRSLQGRKHVVYFSEGFDPALMLGARDEEENQDNFQASVTGEIWKVDSDQMFGSRQALSAMEQLTQEMKKADCTLHSVDIGGLRTSADASSETGGLGAAGRGKDGLVAMARDTGGEVFENFNDLGTAMDRLLEKTSVTYLLTYRPSDLDFDGKYRKLKVKLRNSPSAKLVHRPGYFAPKPAGEEADGLGSLLSASQRLFDRDGGEVRSALLALPQRHQVNGLHYVPTLFEVDGASFLGPEKLGRDRQQARADLFVYAFDPNGGVVDLFTQSISLDLAKMGTALRRTGFKLYAPLLLPEGEFTLRAMVREGSSGRIGVTHDVVKVAATDGLALLPPMLPESMDSWVLVRGNRKDLESQAEPPYPFGIGTQGYAPAAILEARSGQDVPLVLAGYELQEAEIEARLVNKSGEEVQAIPLRQIGSAARNNEGLIQQLVAVTLPKLAGDYRLELVGRRGDGSPETKESIAVVLRSEADELAAALPRRQLAFNVPASLGEPGLSVASTDRESTVVENPALVEKAAESWRAGYRAALAKLGGAEGDLEPLAAFEVAALGEDPAGRLGRLARAEADIAKNLAARDPEALLPLLKAHLDLYLLHKAARRPFLELHSRNMVVELAHHYARAAAGHGSGVVAARALVSLGGFLLADGRAAATEVLEKATVLDPANEAAYLALAAFHEKRGGPYDLALAWLEKLVANRPESREGRLRLAINLLRVADIDNVGDGARREKAVSLFKGLIAEPNVDWITSLAAQELARFQARQRHTDQAIALLEDTLEKLPDDQEILVQLTFLYDRVDNAGAGRKLANKVGQGVGTAVLAPRGRYNQWQSEALDRDRTELQSGAATRLKILDEILTSAASQEGR